jgi:hypothetical protein
MTIQIEQLTFEFFSCCFGTCLPENTLHADFKTMCLLRLKEKKPGDLTDDLRTALGMPVGPNAHKVPPPWLIAMQRYGPPPSYPNLKIPGLNAPIPDGCSFGYHVSENPFFLTKFI